MSGAPTPAQVRVPFVTRCVARCVAVLLACLLGLNSAAAAKPKNNQRAAAKAEVQKAQIDYKLGRFDEALEEYVRAYEMFNAPALLFNIGQCHKNLKHYDRAIFFFEGYLREETKPDPRKRTLAEELILESRAELEKRRAVEAEAKKAAAATAPIASSSVAAVFGPPPPAPPSVPILIDEPQEQTPPSGTLARNPWFWTGVGAGVVVIAAGALAYYFSGPTTAVPPSSTLGTLDRR